MPTSHLSHGQSVPEASDMSRLWDSGKGRIQNNGIAE